MKVYRWELQFQRQYPDEINDNMKDLYPLIHFRFIFCINPEEQVTAYCEKKNEAANQR